MPENAAFRFLVVLFLIALPVHYASAQWSARVAVQSGLDTNPLGLNETKGGQVSSVEAAIDRAGARATLSYTGSYSAYAALPDYDHYWHQGAVWLGNDTTSAGLLAEHRVHVRDNTYGYYRIGGIAAHRFSVFGILVNWQGKANYYGFAELTERNQVNFGTSLRLTRWFQTGTTFMAEGGAGYTVYPDLTLNTQQNAENGTPSARQYGWGLRAAQSLSPATGFAVQYREQRLSEANLAPGRFDNLVSVAILDDPSLYESTTFGAEITQMIPRWRIVIKGGAYITRRRYPTQGVYQTPDIYNQAGRRRDDYLTAWATADWMLQPDWLDGRRIGVELGLQWADNRSNSYWYRYDNTYVALGLSYTF